MRTIVVVVLWGGKTKITVKHRDALHLHHLHFEENYMYDVKTIVLEF